MVRHTAPSCHHRNSVYVKRWRCVCKEFRTIQTESVAEYSDLLNALQLIDIDKRLDLLHFEELYLG